MEKISYERRAYESVDDKSLSYKLYHKKIWKTELVTERIKILATKDDMLQQHATISAPLARPFYTTKNTCYKSSQPPAYIGTAFLHHKDRKSNRSSNLLQRTAKAIRKHTYLYSIKFNEKKKIFKTPAENWMICAMWIESLSLLCKVRTQW